MRRSVRPFWPLGGPFLLRPAVLGEAPQTAPRQRHGVSADGGALRLCAPPPSAAARRTAAEATPLSPHGTGASPGAARGQGHHPSRQGEAIGAQLAPLGVLAAIGPVVGQLRGLCRGAAVQHLGRQGLGHVGGRRQARAWPRRRSLAPTICAAGRAAWSHDARSSPGAGIDTPWRQCSGLGFISIVTDYAYLR